MKTLNKTLSSLMFILMAACFGLLTACGEGFEAKNLEGITSDNNEAVEQDIGRTPPGQTAPEVDQSIYDSFSNELDGLNLATVLRFVLDIKAFGLELRTTEHPGGASENTSARSLLLTGCQSHERTEIFDTSVDYDALTNGERIVAGNNGLYEVLLECTVDSCDELMAIIRRQGDDTTDAIAFIGLEKDGQDITGSRSTTRNYISRQVQINAEETRAALEPMFYLQNHCVNNTVGTVNDGDDDGTVVDPFGGDFGTFIEPETEFRWPEPVGPGDSL